MIVHELLGYSIRPLNEKENQFRRII